MNTYRQINRKPKQPTTQQLVERFKRDMEAQGYHVDATYSTSPYAPSVSVSCWQKRDAKKGTQA